MTNCVKLTTSLTISVCLCHIHIHLKAKLVTILFIFPCKNVGQTKQRLVIREGRGGVTKAEKQEAYGAQTLLSRIQLYFNCFINTPVAIYQEATQKVSFLSQHSCPSVTIDLISLKQFADFLHPFP